VLAGDVDAFEHLIDRYRRYVFGIVMKHVPKDAAEEVAHDAFVRAYRSLPTFKGRSEFRHWLSRVATRTCYDFWRARYRTGEIPMSDLTEEQQNWLERVAADDAGESFERRATQVEARELLEWALAKLSAEDRMVVQLIHIEELPVREAAERLGWSFTNTKVRAFRSRRKLRKILSEHIKGNDLVGEGEHYAEQRQ
jgi:RNA polymerase sigma-70 factor (ECF subfamily)